MEKETPYLRGILFNKLLEEGKFVALKWQDEDTSFIADRWLVQQNDTLYMSKTRNNDGNFAVPLENILSIRKKGYKDYRVHYENGRVLCVKFRDSEHLLAAG